MRASLRSVIGSKFGLRVAGIFVLCALVPLVLASALLLGEFSEMLRQREQRDLDNLVRSYGMGLFGRLGAADDVLQGLLEAAAQSGDDRWIDDQVRRFAWAIDVRRVGVGRPIGGHDETFANMDSVQRQALNRHQAVVVWRSDAAGDAMVSLLRLLPSGALLCVDLSPDWLWGDFLELSDEANLLVLDPADRPLVVSGRHSSRANEEELRESIRRQWNGGKQVAKTDRASDHAWVVSHWELFLRGRFQAPSWRLVVFKPMPTVMAGLYSGRVLFPAIVVLTLLFVSLLSLKLIRRQLRPLELLVEGTRKISRLEFNQPVELEGNDEFSDLARSFNGMSDQLRRQFSALEALSEIDRLLLRSPGLEPILDSVLPRIAGILGCCSVSVLLGDIDAADHGRSYDYLSIRDQRLPVRRLTTDIAALRVATAVSSSIDIPASDSRGTFLEPLKESGAARFRICALRHDARISGFLCVGYDGEAGTIDNASVRIEDFADRLSVVLANIERTERLYEQAHFDPLTRLPNRQHFCDKLNARLTRGGRTESGALMYIDLDHFKRINDTAGHTVGDEVLCSVARRLEECFDAGDVVARLGGDEFAAVIQHASDGESVRQIALRVLERLRVPLVAAGREFRIEASIGITLFPADGRTIEELLKNSDIAMYRAKECGRGQAVFFEHEMQERMQARASLEAGLHRALEHDEFTLLYQPIVDGRIRRMNGVEALIRWPSAPDELSRSPATFVPVAEESDLIVDIGAWVLRTACQQFGAWRREGLDLRYVSVNVSTRQLRHDGFVELVLDVLRSSGMRPGELQLEITEGALAEGPVIARSLGALAVNGVQLALDDFGTGYSSLSYLRNFPIHSVKIDRSFITEMPEKRAACRLVESIIAMATVLEKHVVAEGVETEAQLEFLQAAGCGSIQGYLFGRPVQPGEIAGVIRQVSSSELLSVPTRTARLVSRA